MCEASVTVCCCDCAVKECRLGIVSLCLKRWSTQSSCLQKLQLVASLVIAVSGKEGLRLDVQCTCRCIGSACAEPTVL